LLPNVCRPFLVFALRNLAQEVVLSPPFGDWRLSPDLFRRSGDRDDLDDRLAAGFVRNPVERGEHRRLGRLARRPRGCRRALSDVQIHQRPTHLSEPYASARGVVYGRRGAEDPRRGSAFHGPRHLSRTDELAVPPHYGAHRTSYPAGHSPLSSETQPGPA